MGRRRGATKIARQSLVIDASVGVKWFSRRDEADLAEAYLLLESQERGDLTIWVPDLFFYEVANTLARKAGLPEGALELSMQSLWSLGLRVASVHESLLVQSAILARRANMTVYDACYCALAAATDNPLVTANPRHQGRAMGCQVIPLEKWK